MPLLPSIVIHEYVLSRKFIHIGSMTIISMVPWWCFFMRESMNDTGYARIRQTTVAITASHIDRTKILVYCPTFAI